jgi:regulator of replication initiation timing
MTEIPKCYNIGYNYLKDKYGYRKIGYTEKFNSKLQRARNAKERKELLANITENDYKIVLNDVPEPEMNVRDREIELLLKQYQYGFHINNELYNALVKAGAIEYKH